MNEEQVDFVAIGAHPDDVEIGIGGTLAKLSDQGFRTGIIDLTNAEPTPKNEKYRSPDDYDPDYAEKRLNEAQKAAEILGVQRITLDLPNRRLFDDFEARCKLATLFRRLQPKVVIVMYGKTLMASPDHYQAQLITEGAVFYSRLTKWEKYFDNLPVHRVTSLLYFPVRFLDLNPEGYTSMLVDVTNYIDLKQQAILTYKSQGFVPSKTGHAHFPSMLLNWNRNLGSRIGVEYAEHIISPVPISIDDFGFFMNKSQSKRRK
ncbi:MAG: PIG-L family deacetylase [Candidatus Hodarchaeales archaeon]|jgi:LmbE family N-acetylglucosaminyl deacetylase